jgi:actin-like ATPase involved in cell morphogenesis
MRFDHPARIFLNSLRPLLSLFSADLAIDLGTVNTRIHSRDRGVVVNSR